MKQTFNEFMSLVKENASVNNIPVNGTFELTPRCNLHCRMCFICNPLQAPGEELSGKQWLDIMRQARDEGMLFSMLTGGEAILHKDFQEIYLGMRKLGLYVTLNTNGTTITPEIADMLKKSPPLRVAITLYGSSPEAYLKVTGSADGFRRAIRGVELLRDRGIDFRLRTILTKDTADDIENIARLILSYDVPFSYSNYILPPIWENGNDSHSLRLDSQELIKYSRKIEQAIKEYYSANGNPREHIIEEMRNEYKSLKDKPISAERQDLRKRADEKRKKTSLRCQAGFISFSVTHDGFIHICELARDPAFDIKTMGFQEAFKRLGEAAADIPDCPECGGCPDRDRCWSCPPRHFIETGSYTKKPEYICAYTKAIAELYE